MVAYQNLEDWLSERPQTWLVTGVAGFIGSNLLESLLKLNQRVVGLDNLSTGYMRNLEEVRALVSKEQWSRFKFINGDIRNLDDCRQSMKCSQFWDEQAKDVLKGKYVDYVLHQAALGSVPRSIEDPVTSNQVNIAGFLNMLVAAREAGISHFVYAASSSTYGDELSLPKIEDKIGKPLSPYAVTKLANELYADVFARSYGFKTIGLRYFNVFGRRQDPNGAYAAVIPKWILSLLKNEPVHINGDGETSRDFCYVDNVIQANLLAATTSRDEAMNQIYNVAVGDRTTLNELFFVLRDRIALQIPSIRNKMPVYRDFRDGDVKHSQAHIGKAKELLGYQPKYSIQEGLEEAVAWYLGHKI